MAASKWRMPQTLRARESDTARPRRYANSPGTGMQLASQMPIYAVVTVTPSGLSG